MKTELNNPKAKTMHDILMEIFKKIMSYIGVNPKDIHDATPDEDYYQGFDAWIEYNGDKYYVDGKSQSDIYRGKDNFTVSEACTKRDPTNRFYCFFLYENDGKTFKHIAFVKASDLDYCFTKNNRRYKELRSSTGRIYKSYFYIVPTREILKHMISPMMMFR